MILQCIIEIFILGMCFTLLRCETFLGYSFSSHDIRILMYCHLRLLENCDYLNVTTNIASEFLSLAVEFQYSQPTSRWRTCFGQLCFSLLGFLQVPYPVPKIHFSHFLFLVLIASSSFLTKYKFYHTFHIHFQSSFMHLQSKRIIKYALQRI